MLERKSFVNCAKDHQRIRVSRQIAAEGKSFLSQEKMEFFLRNVFLQIFFSLMFSNGLASF
jgi:hypothetical protein